LLNETLFFVGTGSLAERTAALFPFVDVRFKL